MIELNFPLQKSKVLIQSVLVSFERPSLSTAKNECLPTTLINNVRRKIKLAEKKKKLFFNSTPNCQPIFDQISALNAIVSRISIFVLGFRKLYVEIRNMVLQCHISTANGVLLEHGYYHTVNVVSDNIRAYFHKARRKNHHFCL